MHASERKEHWERIYQTKQLSEVSWYQEQPSVVGWLQKYDIPTSAKIIDIGGGDSFLADRLLELGYSDITVLDISEAAIARAKARLGDLAQRIKWIVADAVQFRPEEAYDFWYDRAAFHFLTDPADVRAYANAAQNAINEGGIMLIGTFSEDGPTKCSGIPIRQYSEASLSAVFGGHFSKLDCQVEDHPTPFGTTQNFVFCSFRRNLHDGDRAR